MDSHMPRCDGYEATRQIKEDPATRSIPVLFFSCWTSSEHRKKAQDAGADAFLSRPTDIEELMQLIRTLLRRKGIGQ